MLGGVLSAFCRCVEYQLGSFGKKRCWGPSERVLAKKMQKAIKSIKIRNLHSNHQSISEKNKLLHTGWFLMFFCPHPRKAHRIKTIHYYPKVLTLTPSTFWWAGAPPAIWVGGMTPCCSCIWSHFYINTRDVTISTICFNAKHTGENWNCIKLLYL